MKSALIVYFVLNVINIVFYMCEFCVKMPSYVTLTPIIPHVLMYIGRNIIIFKVFHNFISSNLILIDFL